MPSPARSGCIVIGHASVGPSLQRRFGFDSTEFALRRFVGGAGCKRRVPLVNQILESGPILRREHPGGAVGRRSWVLERRRVRTRGCRLRSVSRRFGLGVGSGQIFCVHVGRVVVSS